MKTDEMKRGGFMLGLNEKNAGKQTIDNEIRIWPELDDHTSRSPENEELRNEEEMPEPEEEEEEEEDEDDDDDSEPSKPAPKRKHIEPVAKYLVINTTR
jgi:hypothetical protein